MNTTQLHRLHAARELIEIAVVQTCLHALDFALRLEHPTLDEPTHCGDPPTLLHARRLTYMAVTLRRALDDYRQAVDLVLDSRPYPCDDFPF